MQTSSVNPVLGPNLQPTNDIATGEISQAATCTNATRHAPMVPKSCIDRIDRSTTIEPHALDAEKLRSTSVAGLFDRTIGLAVHDDGDTIGSNTVKAAGNVAGGWAGAFVGGQLGAEGGAAIGGAVGAFFGGLDAVPGAAIGGFVGGIAGAAAGAQVGARAGEELATSKHRR